MEQRSLFTPSADLPAETRIIYTDGACSGNPGPGGWAWALAPDGIEFASGYEPHTTNQRMELMAVLRALEQVSGSIAIYSDSTYVVNCFRDRWWVKWTSKGWKNAKGEAVANRDIWEPLINKYVERQDEVSFVWVKGHSGDPMNELVDQIAVAASLGK